MDGSLTPNKGGAAAPDATSKGRIAPKLRAAMKLRIEDGLTIKEACLRAGYSEAGWHLAMKRPIVQVEYEQAELAYIQAQERTFKRHRARAVTVAAELMETAQSEAVRMRAVEFFRGESKQPTVAVQINNSPAGGYVYARPDTQSQGNPTQPIDLTAKDVTREE